MLTINGDANQDTFGSGEQKHNIQRHLVYNLNQEFIHFPDIPLDLEVQCTVSKQPKICFLTISLSLLFMNTVFIIL